MTTIFHVLTAMNQPRLHLWRDTERGGTAQLAYDVGPSGPDPHGLLCFRPLLNHQIHEPAHALLHERDRWEGAWHTKSLPRTAQYRFPA